ncbi:MAG: hypothetical protein WAM11_14160 [Cyanobium sp.]
MNDSYSRSQSEISRIFRITAFGFYVLFACNLVGSALPLRLIDPAWQLNALNTLQNLAFLPLIGTCLLLAGPHLAATGSRQRPGWIRRGSALACIGFLLLIPLQATSIWRLGAVVEIPTNRTIATITAARSEIASSRDLIELNTALAKLPGSPKLPAGLNQPIAQLRQSLQQKLATDLEKVRSTQQERINQRRLPAFLLFCRNLIVNLVFAVCFGAIAGFRVPRLRTRLQIANPFAQLSKAIENWERHRSAKRRAAEISGRQGPVGQLIKTIGIQLNQLQRQRPTQSLATRTETSRRSRRG